MDVFITGGTGLIGAAVVAELQRGGHAVTALARSDRSAAVAEEAGAGVVRGGLADLDVIREAADRAEGVVHLAFANDFAGPEALERAIGEETAALEAMGEALTGSGRPLVMVSGTPWIPGWASTEADPLPVDGPVGGRGRTVTRILGLAERGVRASAVRMPRTVHDRGEGGFAGLLTAAARRSGVSGWVGDGTQRWPAVHAQDAAVLFRLALEQAPAGSAWHAVQDEGDPMREIAEVIGRRLGLPAREVPQEDFGVIGQIFAMDQPASSAVTRERLGWTPVHPRLLEDLELVRP
ncbi:SDR family oxidoreductase [Amnibacterium endophyticum]|uniref:SDR family oxidoreductase n=1 Tax=Amnibacterium endophyticum TaxID=2109337 RepID=A0ABW4LLC4_9MICO